ncbi:hypothetical protein G7Y79_00012g032400 [Physcia stellaris]|nr:hypothetical protein G7Y79_00012g032400 [Physcia stellaris]
MGERYAMPVRKNDKLALSWIMIHFTAWLLCSAILLLHATSVVGITPTVPDLPVTVNVDSPSTHLHNLTILQPSTSTLRKRALSRPLNTCPEPSPSLAPSVFLHSHCNRSRDALAYEITCSEVWTIDRQLADHEPVHDSDYDDDGEWINDGSRYPDDDIREYDVTEYPHDKTYQLSCNEHEICVDGFGSVRGEVGAVAYCVATENFRQIAADRVAHVEVPLILRISSPL